MKGTKLLGLTVRARGLTLPPTSPLASVSLPPSGGRPPAPPPTRHRGMPAFCCGLPALAAGGCQLVAPLSTAALGGCASAGAAGKVADEPCTQEGGGLAPRPSLSSSGGGSSVGLGGSSDSSLVVAGEGAALTEDEREPVGTWRQPECPAGTPGVDFQR